MKTHAWMHAGWTLAAAVAFYAGTKTVKPGDAGNTAGDAAQAAAKARSFGPGSRAATKREARPRRGGETPGPLEVLFGAYSLERVGLLALTEQAITDPSPITRQLAFARLLENMTADNALEIRERMVALDPDNDTWTKFNYAYGALAGKDAFAFAQTSDEPDLNAVLMGWAAADPQGALAALDALPPELEGQRASLEQNLIAGIADHDLGLATQTALRLGSAEGVDERQTNRLMRTVANEALRTGGVESASQWASSLPDGEAKGAAMRRVSEEFVRENPEAAAAWAESHAGQDYAAAAVGEIGNEWAETDPQAAVAWLETLPEGTARNRGFTEALGEWEDNNPEAASAYLNAMPESPQRDAAIAGFARGYAWQDPQASAAWAQSISDPALRERALIQVGFAYHRRDPENARVWLQQSGLTPEQQQRAMVGGRR